MSEKKAKILITGAGGFIGRNLIEYLSGNDKYQVFGMKHSDLDLLDEDSVKQFILDKGISIIIHCANVGGSRKSINEPQVVERNLKMFFNLERCLTPEMHMIHLGSGAEYDRRHYKPKMTEDYFDTYVPADDYGFSKYLISKYIMKTTNITCLRIFGLYGKYEDYSYKFISNAIIKNLLGLPIVINQNVVFDYLFIDDFLLLVEKILNRKPVQRIYNITPTLSIDLISIAKIINKIGINQSEIKVLNAGLNREYSGDNRRLLNEIGPFNFKSYEYGIRKLYEYYQENLDELDLEIVKEDPYLKYCKTLS